MENHQAGAGDHPLADVRFHFRSGIAKQREVTGKEYHAVVVLSAKHYSIVFGSADVGWFYESLHGLVESFDLESTGFGVVVSLLKWRFIVKLSLHLNFALDDRSWHPDHDGVHAGHLQ